MYVPFTYVRCPSCGSVFQARTSIRASKADKDSSGLNHGGESRMAVVPVTVLHTWKDIAAYLGRGVRTAQRWEHDLGMPVHRPSRQQSGSVLAFPEEISDWLHQTPVASTADPSLGGFRPATQRPRRLVQKECA